MAVLFRDDFDGSAGTNLDDHEPDDGGLSWVSSGASSALELDGSGFCIHDNEDSQTLACRSGAGSFAVQQTTTIEATAKIVGPPEGWGQGQFSIAICEGADRSTPYLGIWFYTPNTSGTGTAYVDFDYLDFAASHTETINDLEVGDLIKAKAVYDSVAATVECYINDGLVHTIDVSALDVLEPQNVYMEAERTWWTSPYSNVFALDYIEITDGQAPVVETSDLTGEQIASLPYKVFADLYEGETSTRVPISSCQATLRADTSHYAQIVVPQGSSWAETLAAADHFSIVYAVCSDDGTVLEEIEICRAPTSSISYARGPTNDSATVTGNWDADPLDPFPLWETNRTLYGTQQEFITDAGTRYRCKVDPLMRPSRLALFDDTTAILVEWVSFYLSRSVAYMDVSGQVQALGLRSGTSVGHAGGAAGYSTLTAGHGQSVGHGSAVAVDAT